MRDKVQIIIITHKPDIFKSTDQKLIIQKGGYYDLAKQNLIKKKKKTK